MKFRFLSFILFLDIGTADDTRKGHYTHLGIGPCRGPGGVNDKVNSMYAKEHTQEMCEQACDIRLEGDARCVGYAYCESCNGGECMLYGPGLDGTCSDPSAKNEYDCEAIGSCADPDTATKIEECGVCEGKPTAKERVSCESIGGTWTEGTWTSAGETWLGAETPWTGDSHFSTVVSRTTEEKNSLYNCHDVHIEDHLALCEGVATNTSFVCSFDGLPDEDRTMENCPEGCTFTDAPKVPKAKVPHPGDIGLPGWDPAMSGACRGGDDFSIKPNGKYSNTAGANGVLTQEECAEACLAEPTCIGYTHGPWCVVYGPFIDERVRLNDEHWVADSHEAVEITGTKVNPSYICVTGPPRTGDSSSPSVSLSRFLLAILMTITTVFL